MNAQESKQLTQAPSPGSKTLFVIKTSQDGMLAFIPAKTPISPEVIKLSYEQICGYLQKLGYALKPKPETVDNLKNAAAAKPPQFSADFTLISGIPPSENKPATIRWLNTTDIPKDLVRPNTPFAIIKQATQASPGKSIFGQEIPIPFTPPGEAKRVVVLTPHQEFNLSPTGEITSSKGGQAKVMPDGIINFEPIYTITAMRPELQRKIHFPCSVDVKCDLQGHLEWTIDGDLTVNEFWSAYGLKINGNAVAKSGIQTNFPHDEKKAVTVIGNLEANFIQSSCFIVEGNIKVDKAILASRVTCGGTIDCMGEPGKITGCEIYMKNGSINAKVIGSEKEKPTFIKFYAEEHANGSKVGALSEGTRLQVVRTNIIIKFTQPWPPPTPPAK